MMSKKKGVEGWGGSAGHGSPEAWKFGNQRISKSGNAEIIRDSASPKFRWFRDSATKKEKICQKFQHYWKC
jgi:hypothetical protein